MPIYVNRVKYPHNGFIFHERQPCPEKASLNFYKKVTVKKEKKEGLEIIIEKKDVKVFRELMKELNALVEYQKESCELQDFGNSKTLIPEKITWLDLIAKYKLTGEKRR